MIPHSHLRSSGRDITNSILKVPPEIGGPTLTRSPIAKSPKSIDRPKLGTGVCGYEIFPDPIIAIHSVNV